MRESQGYRKTIKGIPLNSNRSQRNLENLRVEIMPSQKTMVA